MVSWLLLQFKPDLYIWNREKAAKDLHYLK